MGMRLKQGQLPVQAEQNDGDTHQGDHIDDHIRDGMGDELFEQVGVVDHVGHELADLLILVEAQGEPLHVVVDVLAHVGDHAPTGYVSHVGADESQPGAGEIGSQDDDRERGNVIHVGEGGARIGDAGDQQFDDPGDEQLDADQEEHADGGDDQGKGVFAGVLKDELEGFH